MDPSLAIRGKEAETMAILCSVCGKREDAPQGWRLIIELDKPGSGIRNTIFILDEWDESKALGPNATCFCSSECETKYLAIRHHELVA